MLLGWLLQKQVWLLLLLLLDDLKVKFYKFSPKIDHRQVQLRFNNNNQNLQKNYKMRKTIQACTKRLATVTCHRRETWKFTSHWLRQPTTFVYHFSLYYATPQVPKCWNVLQFDFTSGRVICVLTFSPSRLWLLTRGLYWSSFTFSLSVKNAERYNDSNISCDMWNRLTAEKSSFMLTSAFPFHLSTTGGR